MLKMLILDDINLWSSKQGQMRLLVDSETGVVYYETCGMLFPRYDSDGKIMVIPKSQLRERIEYVAKSYAVDHEKKPEFESI